MDVLAKRQILRPCLRGPAIAAFCASVRPASAGCHGRHQCRHLPPFRPSWAAARSWALKISRASSFRGTPFSSCRSTGYTPAFSGCPPQLTATDMMSKYHDLGTPMNVAMLNGISAFRAATCSRPAIRTFGYYRGAICRRGAASKCSLLRMPGGVYSYRLCAGKIYGREPVSLPPGFL